MDDSEKNIATVCIAMLVVFCLGLSVFIAIQHSAIKQLEKENQDLQERALANDTINYY